MLLYVCSFLVHVVSAPTFTHIALAADIWSCVSAGNPLLLKTGVILLTYTNARLLIQVITFSQRPGLHMHTHTHIHGQIVVLKLPRFYCFSLTQHIKKSIFILTLCRNTRMCRHSKWQTIEKHNPIQMIYDLCAKENWPASFFLSTHPLFFSPLLCPHSHKETPDSWPTCLVH